MIKINKNTEIDEKMIMFYLSKSIQRKINGIKTLLKKNIYYTRINI